MTPLDLIQFRRGRGLTMRAAASAFGVSPRTWAGWEQGRPMGVSAGLLATLLAVAADPAVWATITHRSHITPCI